MTVPSEGSRDARVGSRSSHSTKIDDPAGCEELEPAIVGRSKHPEPRSGAVRWRERTGSRVAVALHVDRASQHGRAVGRHGELTGESVSVGATQVPRPSAGAGRSLVGDDEPVHPRVLAAYRARDVDLPTVGCDRDVVRAARSRGVEARPPYPFSRVPVERGCEEELSAAPPVPTGDVQAGTRRVGRDVVDDHPPVRPSPQPLAGPRRVGHDHRRASVQVRHQHVHPSAGRIDRECGCRRRRGRTGEGLEPSRPGRRGGRGVREHERTDRDRAADRADDDRSSGSREAHRRSPSSCGQAQARQPQSRMQGNETGLTTTTRRCRPVPRSP